MQPTRLPRKKDVVLQLLEQATVFVHLDPRAEAVRVPPWFKRQPQLVLQIGLNMPVPIPDLQVDDDGLSCTLSFNRSPFMCVIPWGSVFALVGENRQGMIWPDDVPAEVQAQAAAQQAKPVAPKPELRVAPAPPPEAPADEEAPAKGRAAKPKRTAAAKRPAAKARTASSAPKPAKTKAPAAAKAVAPRAKARAVEKAASPKAAAAKPTAEKTQKPAAKASPAPQTAVKAPPRAQPAAAPQPAAAAGGGAKRKLPPYLRVVK